MSQKLIFKMLSGKVVYSDRAKVGYSDRALFGAITTVDQEVRSRNHRGFMRCEIKRCM